MYCSYECMLFNNSSTLQCDYKHTIKTEVKLLMIFRQLIFESCVSCRFKTFLRPSELLSLIMYRKHSINSLDCNSFPIVVTSLCYLERTVWTSIYNIVMSGSDDVRLSHPIWHTQLILFVLFIRMEITYSLIVLGRYTYNACLILNPWT